MRHALALAALASALAAGVAPAHAQPRARVPDAWQRLDCSARAFAAERAQILRTPTFAEDPAETHENVCLTLIPLPSGAPFRRLAFAQAMDSYWCGTAGCSTFIFGQDAAGRWRDISPQDTLSNAQSSEVRVNTARAFRGMPRLAIRTGGGGAGPGVAEWGWIPRLGRYSE